MDRLDAMAVLLAVVEGGSLSAASRQLRMPLATVSRKVSDLEAHLAVRLITRTNRRILLTETGRSYVEAAKEILARVEEAEKVAGGEYSAVRGDLTMTAPIVFGRLHVLPVVVDFLKAHPLVNIRLTLGDRFANMVDDHIDVVLRIGNLPDSNLVAKRVGSVRRVIYASPNYIAENGQPEHPRALAEHDCITFESLMAARAWTFIENGREISAPIRSRLIVNTAESARDAAVAGLGLTRLLSYQAAEAVAAGLLVPMLEDFEHPAMAVQLGYLPQGLVPMKLRAFVDFATPRLRTVLDGRPKPAPEQQGTLPGKRTHTLGTGAPAPDFAAVGRAPKTGQVIERRWRRGAQSRFSAAAESRWCLAGSRTKQSSRD